MDNTVLVPDPVYPVYVDTNVMAGRRILFADATRANGFLPMPDEGTEADIIYICSPNNPTGAAYSVEQLQAWVDYANARGAIILYDAAYERFVAGEGLARSIFETKGAEGCAIEFCSLSKTAGFTGTRCGYTVVPHALVRGGVHCNKLWLRRQTTKFNGVSYIVQRGAEAVFTEEGRKQIEANLAVYRRNAQRLAACLDKLGVLLYGRQKFALSLAGMSRFYGQLEVLRLSVGGGERRRHAGQRLRQERRRLLPPYRLRERGGDGGSGGAHPRPVPQVRPFGKEAPARRIEEAPARQSLAGASFGLIVWKRSSHRRASTCGRSAAPSRRGLYSSAKYGPSTCVPSRPIPVPSASAPTMQRISASLMRKERR